MALPYYQDENVTLYHADCRDVLPTFADESIDFIFTDPPYGHNNNNGDLAHHWEAALGIRKNTAEDSRPIANDGPEANDLVQWFFIEANRLLPKGGCCCCCCAGGGGPDPQFARWSLWMDGAIGFKHAVVWDKGGLGMGWHYRRNYEMVLIGEKPGSACRWYGDNKVANVMRISGIKPTADMHPTPKPVGLPLRFIELHSQPGEIVLDPFNGGGSTAEAAVASGRKYIGIELEERWLEMTVKRIQQVSLFSETISAPEVENLTLGGMWQ